MCHKVTVKSNRSFTGEMIAGGTCIKHEKRKRFGKSLKENLKAKTFKLEIPA